MRLLGHKAYGSIPHLPGSRTGPSDRHIDEPSARRLTVGCASGERVLVREKLDGTCVAVACHEGEIVALLGANGAGNATYAAAAEQLAAKTLAALQPYRRAAAGIAADERVQDALAAADSGRLAALAAALAPALRAQEDGAP